MTEWTAVVPIKQAADRKTRLLPDFDLQERIALSDFMLHHVLAVLERSPSVKDVILLAASPPEAWAGKCLVDQGRGLNAELQAAVGLVPRALVVLHADLPALSTADVEELIEAAADGVAIAPDRRLQGTNALAAHESDRLHFAFGEDSFARHRHMMPGGQIVRPLGLQLDVDVTEDVREAIRLGYLPSPASLLFEHDHLSPPQPGGKV